MESINKGKIMIVAIMILVGGLSLAYEAKQYNPTLKPIHVQSNQRSIQIEERNRQLDEIFRDQNE